MGAIKVFLLTALVFSILIFVHELGHFIACRIFGVRVNEFAIGMGPKLFSVKSKRSETVYSLRILPIGGFNNIEDGSEAVVNDDGTETLYTPEASELPPYAFGAKPVWQRMIIIVAGALMNLLLGIAVMSIVVLRTENYASTTFSAFFDLNEYAQLVEEGKGASELPLYDEYNGLRAGDKVIKIGSRRIFTGDELVYNIFEQGGKAIDFTVLRDGKKLVIKNVDFPTDSKQGITYGVRNFYVMPEEKNLGNTLKHAFFGSVNCMVQVFDSLKGMITGKYGIEHISGPIGVGEVIGEAASVGLDSLLNITVLLSMNLGIFNLLPIPALDGGKLVFLLIEAIIKKPLPKKIEENATMVGMILLLCLIFLVAFKDVFTLFK